MIMGMRDISGKMMTPALRNAEALSCCRHRP